MYYLFTIKVLQNLELSVINCIVIIQNSIINKLYLSATFDSSKFEGKR